MHPRYQSALHSRTSEGHSPPSVLVHETRRLTPLCHPPSLAGGLYLQDGAVAGLLR